MRKFLNSINLLLWGIGICLLIGGTYLLFIPYPELILAIPFAIPLVLIAVIGALAYPFLVVISFVAFSYFRIHEAIPQIYPLRIPLILAIATAGVLTYHIAIRNTVRPYWRYELSILSVFAAQVLLSVIFSTNRANSLEFFLSIFAKTLLMVPAIIWLTRKSYEFKLTTYTFIICGTLLSVIGLINKFKGVGLVEGSRITIAREFSSVLGDPNDLASILLCPLSFAAALYFSNKKIIFRLISILSFLLILYAIFSTQSRGGLLGAATIFYVYFARVIKPKKIAPVLGLISLVIMALLSGISDRSSGGINELSQSGVDASSMGRIYAWGASIEMAIAHPIAGVGVNNFLNNFWEFSSYWDGQNKAAHSAWFEILGETGFAGLIVYLILISRILKVSRENMHLVFSSKFKFNSDTEVVARALHSSLLGIIVSSTFLSQGFAWSGYIIFSLTLALNTYVKKRINTKQCYTLLSGQA
ncbi:MAG: oligosaccharide repeat unit polymerase [Cyanobium sp. ARS6]|nr:oligosaccharide repeat unit polymerase [Cyanobium sp. ARS6]